MSSRVLSNQGWILAAVTAWSLALGGCRSHFIQAQVENRTDQPLHVLEVDYPGASFGVSTLQPHASYTYRFKLLGSGPLALSYNDDAGKPHTAAGPDLKEGAGGSMSILIEAGGRVSWQPRLSPP